MTFSPHFRRTQKALCVFPLVASLALSTSFLFAGQSSTARPNVLLIISDDHAWSDYGFMGHRQIQTPHLDRLASRSVVFERGYSPVPLCRPSLASIATGLYPHQHGVTGNDPDLPDKGVNSMTGRSNPKYERYYETIVAHFAQRPNLVRDLTGRGYVALQTGKWWEGDPVKVAGFTHAMTEGTGKGDRHGGAGLDIGRKGLEPVYKFIANAGTKPWLLWYAPMLPHSPHTPPQDLLQKYLKLAPNEPMARYWACVEWFDRTCGELFGFLERTGRHTNTIVLYTADNGYLQDPSRANLFAPRSKNTPYEGGVRTPIMVSWPGRVVPRTDSTHPACNVDLWPTLAALIGVPIPGGLPGINLTDPKAITARQRIFGEQYAHNIADVDEPTRSLGARWVVDAGWKLIVPDPRNHPGAKPELYRVEEDPWEKTDLAEKDTDRVSALRRQLDAWWAPHPVTSSDNSTIAAGTIGTKSTGKLPPMMFGDTSRLGRPFAKDPSVIRLGDRYLMYFSLPPFAPEVATNNSPNGWSIGIAESHDLGNWTKIGELLPEQECDQNGLCAPAARVLNGQVHLFYQTYGNGPRDAICHAISGDGLHFLRDPANPVFRPVGGWNNGRAIDAEVFPFGGRLLLYFATRDPTGQTQMVGIAAAPLGSSYSRGDFQQICSAPILKPELSWEKRCIEAPSVLQRGESLYLFYAGGYNNDPQQVGVATSRDGVSWKRLSEQPLLPNGPPGSWNSSESGHPGIFEDADGRTYLFYQGNHDKGRTWFLSSIEIQWRNQTPIPVPTTTETPR